MVEGRVYAYLYNKKFPAWWLVFNLQSISRLVAHMEQQFFVSSGSGTVATGLAVNLLALYFLLAYNDIIMSSKKANTYVCHC